jgi:hypothetical protein
MEKLKEIENAIENTINSINNLKQTYAKIYETDPDNININFENNMLSIQYKAKEESGVNFRRLEEYK